MIDDDDAARPEGDDSPGAQVRAGHHDPHVSSSAIPGQRPVSPARPRVPECRHPGLCEDLRFDCDDPTVTFLAEHMLEGGLDGYQMSHAVGVRRGARTVCPTPMVVIGFRSCPHPRHDALQVAWWRPEGWRSRWVRRKSVFGSDLKSLAELGAPVWAGNLRAVQRLLLDWEAAHMRPDTGGKAA